MRGNEAQKAATRRLVLEQLGVDYRQPRGFASQANSAGMEAQLLRLPASQAVQVDLQDPDTGDFYFMVDAHPIDSDDYLIQ